MDLFTTIENKLGKLPIIAEDLGFLTDSVKQLLASTGFPGMKVLEFAFDSRDTGSGYLPHCYPNNCVVYTGTHVMIPFLAGLKPLRKNSKTMLFVTSVLQKKKVIILV